MRIGQRLGLRGALVLLGALPVLVASIAVGWLVAFTQREANRSIEDAEATVRLELVTRFLAQAGGEIAVVDGWARTAEIRQESQSEVVGLWLLTTVTASDAAWDAVLTSADELDPDTFAELRSIRTDIEAVRDLYVAGSVEPLADQAAMVKTAIEDVAASVSDGVLDDLGAAGAVLVEVVTAEGDLIAEATLLSQALARGVVGEANHDELVIARERSDQSVDRLRRDLDADTRQEFDDVVADTQSDWIEFRTVAIEQSSAQAAALDPTEFARLLQVGTAFVTELSEFRNEQFATITETATADSEAAIRSRNLILVLGGAVLVAVGLFVALVGRRLIGRIGSVSAVAEQVSAGELDLEPLRMPGHDEVARLAGAMDDLVVTLQIARRQVDALAAGRTDDPTLAEELPGSIGETLREAIRRLGRSTEELKRQATHDALTGLLDRNGLDQVTESWESQRSEEMGVIMLDLDGFKLINDDYGHRVGDRVLEAIAQRLSSLARSSDVVARIGGDEFVVLLASGVNQGVMEQVSQRLVFLTGQPIVVDGVPLEVGASVGWVLASSDTPTELALRQADGAMYEAKRTGKGRAVQGELA